MFGVVYKLTNTITNKMYVGQTTADIDVYMKGVLNKTRFNKARHLDNAIQKYGPSAWVYEVICYANSREELDALEIHYIAALDTRNTKIGYNICRGGERGPGWKKGHNYAAMRSPEERRLTAKKIGDALRGVPKSESHKKALTASRLGEKNHFYGKKHSPETLKKMSESAKNRKKKRD